MNVEIMRWLKETSFNFTLKKTELLGRPIALMLIGVLLSGQTAYAGQLRERIGERIVENLQDETNDNDKAGIAKADLPAIARIEHDVSYGPNKRQCFDVYIPAGAKNAPIIFMVHGGAWRMGDKSSLRVVKNKMARWLPKGFIFISANYRMLPEADPVMQARDVVCAIALVQEKAGTWGGDRNKIILMGHSAGAHLVALIASNEQLSTGIIKTPWLGVIALDSATYDVVRVMEKRHLPLYDKAFAAYDKNYWQAASPFYVLTKKIRPMLAVCSSRRKDSLEQAHCFAEKAAALGGRVNVLEKDLSHMEINERLGEDEVYTQEIEAFMADLDKTVAEMIGKR